MWYWYHVDTRGNKDDSADSSGFGRVLLQEEEARDETMGILPSHLHDTVVVSRELCNHIGPTCVDKNSKKKCGTFF